MAVAKLYGTFVLLLYLQEIYAQQGLNNNQNVGVNSGIGFQQQATQRMSTLNNVNQIPNGALNINVPQQGNLQQVNGGNIQQQLSLPANLQPQGGSGSLANLQFKQGLAQLPPGLVINPTRSQVNCPQINNVCNQNTQSSQQQNNVNVPFSNSLAELAALKGPSLLSLLTSQINGQNQNQPMANFSPTQNQLTDIQKQLLARAIQGPNQPCNLGQARPIVESRPTITIQGQPAQQPQAIVTPVGQPPYIAVQAQPLPTYIQNQPVPVPVTVVEEPSALSFILSDLQPDAQYFYPPYQLQKRESKSNLKTLIPLIIDLLKEKNACGCRNCGCPNNIPEPTVLGGYSNIADNRAENKKADDENEEGKKESKEKKKLKKNAVNNESEEASEENDSDYEDDSTGD
ncbi:hypothetical protein HF086_005047 [Spodoptera exigua]|uniref:Uncharacterized protein n=1 Tax=Spodoptera exigua TaxID=7107 RepID=A0A922ML13_SPOEX|nr:hypothetical protein HF086_005047 [Spodoptera exigua]